MASWNVTKTWLSGMSPDAADCASAERAAGDESLEREDVAEPEEPQPPASARTAPTAITAPGVPRLMAISIPRAL